MCPSIRLCGCCCSFSSMRQTNFSLVWARFQFCFPVWISFAKQIEIDIHTEWAKWKDDARDNTWNESANKNEDEHKIEQTRRGTKHTLTYMAWATATTTGFTSNSHGSGKSTWIYTFCCLKSVQRLRQHTHTHISIHSHTRFMCFEIFLRKVNLWGPNDNSLSQSSNQSVDIRNGMMHQGLYLPLFVPLSRAHYATKPFILCQRKQQNFLPS